MTARLESPLALLVQQGLEAIAGCGVPTAFRRAVESRRALPPSVRSTHEQEPP